MVSRSAADHIAAAADKDVGARGAIDAFGVDRAEQCAAVDDVGDDGIGL
jgi:hypothetical protein